MDLRPWNYWTNAGKPRAPSHPGAVTVLERVVKRKPGPPRRVPLLHPRDRGLQPRGPAVPCAERLGSLCPGQATWSTCRPTSTCGSAGGTTRRSITCTRCTWTRQYIDARHPTGVYPIGYVPHNYHVMWEALNMLGRSEEALDGGADDRREGAGRRGAQDPAVRVLLAGGAVHPRALLPVGRHPEGAGARGRICVTPPASGTTPAGLPSRRRASSTRRRSSGTAWRRSRRRSRPRPMANLNSDARGAPDRRAAPRRRDGGKAEADGRGGASASRRHRDRGRAHLRRAARLVASAPPAAGRRPPRRRPAEGGGEGVPGGPGALPEQRLVAARAGAEPRRLRGERKEAAAVGRAVPRRRGRRRM